MFHYLLDSNTFTSKENFKAAVKIAKGDSKTVDAIKALVDSQIIQRYNAMVEHFFKGEEVNSNIVFTRESVELVANHLPDHEYAYFAILVNNGIIGVCGSGYTFEREQIVNEEINKLAKIAIEKGFQI